MSLCKIIRNRNTNEIERVLAPNGQDSKLFSDLTKFTDKETALRSWAQVYTPSFKSWFGDWETSTATASKVVDENGEPRIMYHGTAADFDTFNVEISGSVLMGAGDERNALNFTSDREIARKYSKTWNDSTFTATDGNILPVFLKALTPEVRDYQGEGKGADFVDVLNAVTGDAFVANNIADWGVSDVIRVFEPSQVKSVFNEGSFDSGNSNIYHYGSTANTVTEEVRASNQIFESQIYKIGQATNGTLVQGKVISKEVLNDILDDIISKAPREDYDHIGIDHTRGRVEFYNSKSPEANERAKRAAKILQDLTQRTGLKYQTDYYLANPGEFREGKVIINPYHPKFGTDIVWHEAIGHPVVEAVFQQAENSALYNSLKAQIDENVGGIQEYMEQEYPEYEKGSDEYYKEAITTLLGRYMDFVNKTVDKIQVIEEIDSKSALVRFLDRFLARVKNILNDMISHYKTTTKRIRIEDLKDKSLTVQELATLLGATESYIDLTGVDFTDTFFAKTSTVSSLEQAVDDAQTQGVRKAIEIQLQDAYKQASKQFKILKNKVTPEQRKSLIRILQYLEDPDTFGKTRTFAAYLAETDSLLRYYLADGKKIAREVTDVRDKLNKLAFILQVANSYEPTINSLDQEYLNVDDTNEIKKVIKSSKSSIADIQALYTREVEGPIADILADSAASVADEVFQQLDNEIKFLEGRLALRSAESSEAKTLLNRIVKLRQQRDQLVPTRENILTVMKGQRGDVNILSMYLESTTGSGDLTVASFAKMIKDLFNAVRERMLPLRNRAQEQLTSYSQATGRSTTNNAAYYEGLYELVPRGEINQETGELEIKEYYALVGQYNQQYVVDQQRFYSEMNKLKKEGQMVEFRAKQQEFEAWKNTYMEQEYTEAYYAAEKLLTPQAKEAQTDLFNQIAILKDLIKANGGSVEDSDELDLLWTQYGDLGRTYDRTGKKKTGDDLAIAESIQKFRLARREMETYELTDEGKANFAALKQRMQDRLDADEITQEQFDKWVRRNTTRRIDPKFYEERKKITDRISAIQAKIPPEVIGKRSTDDLWEAIFSISANHRDFDRVVDGTDLNSDELSVVKGNENALEQIRITVIGQGGLSPKESRELNALFNADTIDEDDSQRIQELMNKKKTKKAEIEKYISPIEYKLLLSSYDELSRLQESLPTQYYEEMREAQYNAWLITQPDAESATRAMLDSRFEDSEWFKANHIWQTKPLFNSEGQFQGYIDQPQPLYVWRDVVPKDKTQIDYNYPSFKYLDRVVKPQYLNPNFKNTIDGYNAPKLTIVEGTGRIKSKYVNASYEKLRDDAAGGDSNARAKWDMLQFLTSTYEDAQRKLPQERRMGLLLPAIERDLVDRLQASKGWASAGKQYWENTKRNWTVTSQDRDIALGDVAGMEFSYIPVKFTGKMDKDNINLNLMESVMRFRLSSEEYEVLEQTLPIAEGLEKIIDDDANRISTGKIDAVLQKLGFNVQVLKRGKSNRAKQINEFIKSVWYGELQKDEHIGNISINKITNNLMGVASLQILALNLPAHTTNWLSGNIQAFIEANAGQFFNKSDFGKAKKVYAQNIKNFWQDYRKEGKKSLMTQLTELYDVPQGIFEDEFGQKTDYSNLREGKGWLFFTKNAGEHEIQVSTFIAMASNKRVKYKDSTIPLLEAYELDSNGDIVLKEGVELSPQQKNDFNGKVHGLLKGLNGNYNKFDRPLVEKYSIGRLMSFMRKYLVPMATRRLAGTRLNMELGEVNQGYYLTFAKTFLYDLKAYHFNVIARWNDLSDKEKQSVRRTIMDLGLISIFFGAILLLGGYDDDRDLTVDGRGLSRLGNGEMWKLQILYQLMKVKSETENFLPLPGFGYDEALRTVTTTTIAWRSLQQLSGVFEQFVYLSINSDKAYYDKDSGIWEQGDIKFLAKLGKLGGFTGNTLYPELMIRNFELGQKVK